MNKISLFVLLILIFLGLSKSFSPSETKTKYIRNEKILGPHFPGAPLSVILLDSFTTGFLIKTHFQRYKIIHAFKQPQIITVRTSKNFWDDNLKNKGMSIFRRHEHNNKESSLILPPGSLYIGNPSFGRWRLKNSGMRVWSFYHAYRDFPRFFYWGKYRPNKEFFTKMKAHIETNKPFYGLNNEFGSEGSVTKENIVKFTNHKKKETINFKEQIKKYIRIPPWSLEE